MSRYQARIRKLHQQLGIPDDYTSRYGLPLYPEAQTLEEIGVDTANRPRQLTPEAARQWQAMQQQATEDGVELQVVSAYRSVARQAEIIQYKLDQGQSMEQILCVSAAPGHSEHHTGNALDLTTPGYPALEETFENSPAFLWLTQHAQTFGFYLSYPKDNEQGISYEPWHWSYHPH